MRGNRSEPSGAPGLTLLELLTTLTILAMLGAVVLGAFRLGARSWQRGEERAEAEQRLRVIQGIFARELASLQPITALADREPVTAFRGRSDWISFHTAPAGHGPFPYSAMVRGVAYSVEPGKGLIVRESYPLAEGRVSLDPGGTIKVLDPEVSRLTFRYLAAAPQGKEDPLWVEAWSPHELSGETPAVVGNPAGVAALPSATDIGLPLAVEVTVVRAERRGEREVRFVIPIRVGRTI